MTDFQSVDEFFESRAAKPKTLPVWGKDRQFPGRLSAEVGLVLLRMQNAAKNNEPSTRASEIAIDVLGDEAQQVLSDALMGPGVEDELVAEGVPPELVAHVYQTLIVWHLRGRDAAVQAFSQMPGEPAPSNRATRRSTASKATGTKAPRGSTASSKGRPAKATSARSQTPRSSRASRS